MKIVYGVYGCGRGNASRSLLIAKELQVQGHQVFFIAGGDAYDWLAQTNFPVVKVPVFHFEQNKKAFNPLVTDESYDTTSTPDDFFYASMGMDPSRYSELMSLVAGLKPDLLLSDSEALTNRAGKTLDIPLISIDRFASIQFGNFVVPSALRESHLQSKEWYRRIRGDPQLTIGSSFHTFNDHSDLAYLLGPVVSPEIERMRDGDRKHVLVYGDLVQYPGLVEKLGTLPLPVIVYGADIQKVDVPKNVECRVPDHITFRDAFRDAAVVLGTAGNQLSGESLVANIPIAVIAEPTFEQRLNAHLLQKMYAGIAFTLEDIAQGDRLLEFVDQRERFQTLMPTVNNSLQEVVERLQPHLS